MNEQQALVILGIPEPDSPLGKLTTEIEEAEAEWDRWNALRENAAARNHEADYIAACDGRGKVRTRLMDLIAKRRELEGTS